MRSRISEHCLGRSSCRTSRTCSCRLAIAGGLRNLIDWARNRRSCQLPELVGLLRSRDPCRRKLQADCGHAGLRVRAHPPLVKALACPEVRSRPRDQRPRIPLVIRDRAYDRERRRRADLKSEDEAATCQRRDRRVADNGRGSRENQRVPRRLRLGLIYGHC